MDREEIKSRYTMADIAMRYGLKPNRSGFVCCPFHKEKSASMKLYKHDYNCFGCGANGDIFRFVMDMDGVTFKEAYIALGGVYELESPESRSAKMRRLAMLEAERKEQAKAEQEFYQWRMRRLSQICNLLMLCDQLQGAYDPFSDEWCIVLNMVQLNEFKYNILAFGTRQEQEEMRVADG